MGKRVQRVSYWFGYWVLGPVLMVGMLWLVMLGVLAVFRAVAS